MYSAKVMNLVLIFKLNWSFLNIVSYHIICKMWKNIVWIKNKNIA